MIWEGDIYHETSGDYRIDTQYAHTGTLSLLRHKGALLGYAKDRDEAKRQAEAHARKAKCA